MTSYRVRFFKRLVNSQGTPFRALQRETGIIEAKTALEAEAIAAREFAQLRQITDWRVHADSMETETIADPHRQRRSRPAGQLRAAAAS